MSPRTYNRGTPEQRFVARVAKSEGCWEWQGYRLVRRGKSTGHGKFGLTPSQTVLAHRFAYELWVGPIPEGAVVHHRCENPACVRPDHLELKSNVEHTREHTHGRGVVENQYGVWPIARTPEERRIRGRDWMRAFRARKRAAS